MLPGKFLNLHGGNPITYRGLDSHLWAIYHEDFSELVTSIHLVEPELDTGKLINKRPIKLKSKMKLYQLRAENTLCCIALTLEALENLKNNGEFNFFDVWTERSLLFFYAVSIKRIMCKKVSTIYRKNRVK